MKYLILAIGHVICYIIFALCNLACILWHFKLFSLSYDQLVKELKAAFLEDNRNIDKITACMFVMFIAILMFIKIIP